MAAVILLDYLTFALDVIGTTVLLTGTQSFMTVLSIFIHLPIYPFTSS